MARRYRRVVAELIESAIDEGRIDSEDFLYAEIGVRMAETTASMLGRFPGMTAICVDTWTALPATHPSVALHDQPLQPHEKYYDFLRQAIENLKEFHDRWVLYRMPSAHAARFILPSSIDVIFIDADHYKGGIDVDLAIWYPKLRSRGVFCGHDYTHAMNRKRTRIRHRSDGTVEQVKGPDGKGLVRWHVKKAVDEFAAATKKEVVKAGRSIWVIQ